MPGTFQSHSSHRFSIPPIHQGLCGIGLMEIPATLAEKCIFQKMIKDDNLERVKFSPKEPIPKKELRAFRVPGEGTDCALEPWVPMSLCVLSCNCLGTGLSPRAERRPHVRQASPLICCWRWIPWPGSCSGSPSPKGEFKCDT